MTESDLMRTIQTECGDISTLFRANVGRFKTADGRTITTGLPNGFSDLFGVRTGDGKAIFLEIKTASGRVSEPQRKFIQAMKNNGAIAGIARSVEEARDIILGVRK